jgi:hypothetical protein
MSYGTNAPQGLQPIASVSAGAYTQKMGPYFVPTTTNAGVTTGYGTSIFSGDPVVFNTLHTDNTFEETAGTVALYNPTYADAAPSTFAVAPILGVFQGCRYTDPTGKLVESNFWPASTIVQTGSLIEAFIADDPYAEFTVQISTHVNASAANFAGLLVPALPLQNPITGNVATLGGGFGSNFALNVGGGTNFDTIVKSGTNLGYANNPTGGNTRTGISAYYLDITTPTGGDRTHDYNKTLATLPLKAIGYDQNPENLIPRNNPVDTLGSPILEHTAFLNVRVMINNHAYKAGTLGTIFGAAQN